MVKQRSQEGCEVISLMLLLNVRFEGKKVNKTVYVSVYYIVTTCNNLSLCIADVTEMLGVFYGDDILHAKYIC